MMIGASGAGVSGPGSSVARIGSFTGATKVYAPAVGVNGRTDVAHEVVDVRSSPHVFDDQLDHSRREGAVSRIV